MSPGPPRTSRGVVNRGNSSFEWSIPSWSLEHTELNHALQLFNPLAGACASLCYLSYLLWLVLIALFFVVVGVFFFYMAASGTLISGVKSGSLQGGNTQRNQIQLYKRVSHSCLVKTPHLPAPLQVNNQGRVSSAGPWHTYSPHPLYYRKQTR